MKEDDGDLVERVLRAHYAERARDPGRLELPPGIARIAAERASREHVAQHRRTSVMAGLSLAAAVVLVVASDPFGTRASEVGHSEESLDVESTLAAVASEENASSEVDTSQEQDEPSTTVEWSRKVLRFEALDALVDGNGTRRLAVNLDESVEIGVASEEVDL
jgi:hypothetical protein